MSISTPGGPVVDEAVGETGGADQASRRLLSPRRAVAVAYVCGIFMSALDMHIVNVAIPTLGRSFGASIAQVQWTVVAYLLSLAVVIPAYEAERHIASVARSRRS